MSDDTAIRLRSPVPEEVREAASRAPGQWLGLVDPAWSGPGAPPEWALVGHWWSDEGGEVADWRDNDDYRPSPAARGWAEPTDAVDEAAQLAATGYGDAATLYRELAEAVVAVLLTADDRIVTASTPDGAAVVPVYSSAVHLDAAGPLRHEVIPVVELLPRLPEGHDLYLNPTGPAVVLVPVDDLRRTPVRTEAA
ncbi:type VII secretion system-associated protein [Actinosynnema sp. NPDC053489]|uniref:type VII secretion system-associated protein n=1 Tax=Actinosynnema sp. NPDC053489 TaxID=3363916 RepID=UPI0037CAF1A9